MNKSGQDEFRHHIAQGYLKGFKKPTESLYCYDYSKKIIREIGLKSDILGEMNFYTGDTETFINKFETDFAFYRDCLSNDLDALIQKKPDQFAKIISVFFLRSKCQKDFWFELSKKVIDDGKPIPLPTEGFTFLSILMGGRTPYLNPPKISNKEWSGLVQDTFENEIKNENNKITQFILDCLLNNKYVIMHGSGNFVTSENPIIILDKNNHPVKFEPYQNIDNILFSLNANTRIYFYGENFQPMTDWFGLFKELLESKYCDFIISPDKVYLMDKLKKLKFEF